MSVRKRLRAAVMSPIVACAVLCMLAFPIVAFADDGPVLASEKSETVNVTANANGEVRKVEVDATLKNPDKAQLLRDWTALENVEGEDGAYADATEEGLVWHADGKDVKYKGATGAPLPITIYVTYRLNGLIVNPDEIAGKAGEVSIRYDFENSSAFTSHVKGNPVELFTPFTCITALMLDGDTFSNVKVTNGKVIDDGSDSVVTGYAMPGLKKSLGPLAEDAKVPDYFEVTATTSDFNLKKGMTIVTAGLMSDLDVDDMGFGDMDGTSEDLSNGMGELIDGADELKKGLKSLADGASELNDGASQVSSGADSLAQGLYLLTYGKDGKSGMKASAGSAGKLVDAMGDIETGLKSLTNKKKGLPAAADGLEQLAAAYPDEKTLAALEQALGASNLDKKTLKAVVGILESTKQVSQLADGVSQASDAATSLSEGYSKIVDQAEALPDGLKQAADAAGQLYDGSKQLADGAAQLSKGTAKLSGGMKEASEGSGELADGLVTFDQEGISKIVSTIDDDIGGFKKRLSILSDAAAAYATFTGKADGTTGSVKFIYETDEISVE